MSEPIDWVAAAKRVDLFLQDEAVLQKLTLLEQQYIGEFKQAQSSQELFRAQARMNALDELRRALRMVQTEGDVVQIAQQRAEDKAKREKGLLQT